MTPLAKLRVAVADAAFALETVAHMQRREKELLPYVDKLRAAMTDYQRDLDVGQAELPF